MKKSPKSIGPALAYNAEVQTLYAKNLLMERSLLLRRWLEPTRDVDAECGHPVEITIEDYKKAFDRGDLASRVVSVWPDECWSEDPKIFEQEEEQKTKFELAWEELEKRLKMLSMMQRADVMSGVGRFGLILLGFDDGKRLDQPITLQEEGSEGAQGEVKLVYIRVFDESFIEIDSYETDTKNPRYGQPVIYNLTLGETTNEATGKASLVQTRQKVHWTRVVHLTDNRTSSEVFGEPRLKKVWNRVLDVKKIAGGSGEMFWKGGFPGLSLETHPSDVPIEIDTEATKKQIDAYQNGLQRYLTLTGMQAKSLTTQVADPTQHVDVQIRLISMTLGIPWRVFLGSEAAQLASEQDTRAWNRRLTRRRNKYLTPFLIMPVIDRLIQAGVLPRPKQVIVEWPSLNTLTDKEEAEVAKAKTEALSKYILVGGNSLIPPFFFLTLVMGFTHEEAVAILDEVGDDPDLTPPAPPAPAAPAKRAPAKRAASRNGS